jgi:hypothetical protein
MPAVEGPITDDALPTPHGGATAIDDRFRPPAPAARKTGCLPLVFLALAAAGAWWHWG